ncbi:sensor histidine kinase [Pilimelia columellifera]|uniref:histidine kinase n=1 Tax=Pilimelia columellifera subsp. columellifera TaxID=706583 RepID=A0ABN3NS89_9ACTN
MNTRNWSIRSKMIALLVAPVAAMLLLWGYAVSLAARPAVQLLRFETLSEQVAEPAERLVTELQRERQLSLVYLGGQSPLPSMDQHRDNTDRAAAVFRRLSSDPDARDALRGAAVGRLAEVHVVLDSLASGRALIDRREVNRVGALAVYTVIIDAVFQLLPAIAAVGDQELGPRARSLISLSRSRELLAQEDALVSGALRAGRFVDDEASKVSQLIGLRRLLAGDAAAALPESGRAGFRALTTSRAATDLVAMEDVLVARARPNEAPPVETRQWREAAGGVAAAARAFEVGQARAVAAQAEPIAVRIVLRLALAGILGLLALLATILISVRIARSVLDRLGQLRQAALELSGERLPGVVARLRRGEEVNVAEEAPALSYGPDELGELGRAFAQVQRTAVRAAVDEAAFRKGLNDVFLNIARRNQTLLYRQLALLDAMERDAIDPDVLADLFRVDHLATRMRRHAEDLVILAGARPSRGWREPVPLVDVIRGSVSEVEDYARVDVRAGAAVAVVGRAVGDVIHLLAELVENATSYSPPQSRVRVSAQAVPSGVAIEVEDRGLGMSAEALADANARLASPPEFEPATSARLGLFVVARLAARHGVAVQLRQSPYGGVTAVALLPPSLAVTDEAGAVAARAPAQVTRRDGRLWAVPDVALPRQRMPSGAAALPVGAARPDGRRPSAPAEVSAEVSADGLPKRVRQASLAPQLRADVTASGPTGASGSAAEPTEPLALPGGRTPAQVRQLMSELQSQTRRGRADAVRGLPAGPGEEEQ